MKAAVTTEAGPALDALIAERVMGWRHKIMPRGAKAWLTNPDGGWLPQKDFRPSSRIEDAWQVVAQMGRDTFSFQIYMPHEMVQARVSFVCYYGPCLKHGNPHHNHHGAYDVEAPTATLAICVAALKAKGIRT